MTALAWLVLIAIALSAIVVCLVPIAAAPGNRRADQAAYEQAAAKLTTEERQALAVDAEWDARCREYERLFPSMFRDLTPDQEAAVARVEIALASTEQATNAELWRLIEEAR